MYVQDLLNPKGGTCYLVLVEENKPKEIIKYATGRGMKAQVQCSASTVNIFIATLNYTFSLSSSTALA